MRHEKEFLKSFLSGVYAGALDIFTFSISTLGNVLHAQFFHVSSGQPASSAPAALEPLFDPGATKRGESHFLFLFSLFFSESAARLLGFFALFLWGQVAIFAFELSVISCIVPVQV